MVDIRHPFTLEFTRGGEKVTIQREAAEFVQVRATSLQSLVLKDAVVDLTEIKILESSKDD